MKKTWSMSADLVIKNVKIYTVSLTIDEIRKGVTDFPVYEEGFVAAKDGKTIAVGEGLDESLIGENTKVIDGSRKVLIPGLIDSHMHAVWAGLEMMNVDFSEAKSKKEFLEKLKERVKVTPAGQWIRGDRFNELNWDENVLPTRYDLDEITTEHPVVCVRLCHHIYVVNSKALELAGINKDTPDPEGSVIARDEDGVPTGILKEGPAIELIDKVFPAPTEEQVLQAIENAGKVMNSYGLTACIDANLPVSQMRIYQQAAREKRLSYRSRLMFFLDKSAGDIDYLLKKLDEMGVVTGFGDDMVRLNAVKLWLDGVPAMGTAYMREPYEHMPETCGMMVFTPEEVTAICERAAKYYWQVGIHACGDKSVDVALEAFRAAGRVREYDARHYIIHNPLLYPDQLPLMKELNVSVTQQPTIALQMGEQSILGEKTVNRYSLTKEYFNNGIIVGGSTDFPVVTCNPFLGMYAAITRYDSKGIVYRPDQKLSAAQALIMWTKNSAYLSHEDDVMGSVEVGNYADYVLIDTPILEVGPEAIRDTRVLATFLGGKLVYERS